MDAGIICRLLKKDADAEIFEDVLLTLMTLAQSVDQEGPEKGKVILFIWLSGLSQVERFDMLIRFVAPELRERVCDWLVSFQKQCDVGDEVMAVSIAAALQRFKK